ncbi:copper homeostasis protein CutC [Prevotella sp. kh1p2]|uniref:copper homeostasis protein CutC n=1 Tax=Prevotella sp. kh1p2 TaxID=1761883 RepID=UPI0008ABAF95|nr:copper homeostasis protein CutC [Prevotella sp. kh1p2]SES65684.1 copper homeostasis protein [Prevotella sp. kh1p2]SNU09996.1 copper homeostasis protein [Prevotellaceae bacterium KH2P17]
MTRENFKFEICANGVESCLAAQEGGADRVELCAGIPEGGTTPSYGEITVARRLLTTTRLHVIIRPRGGHFVYSPLELERMEADIRAAKELGADGVVFGCLNPDGSIDAEANSRLLASAQGMSVTFHRAFDRCSNPTAALEQLISLGFDRILTSGQQPTADQGTALLARLHRQAAGRIILLAGCGVNETNIHAIYAATGIREYHFSARERVAGKMLFRNPAVFMGSPDADEDTLLYTTPRRVRATISSLIDRGE